MYESSLVPNTSCPTTPTGNRFAHDIGAGNLYAKATVSAGMAREAITETAPDVIGVIGEANNI